MKKIMLITFVSILMVSLVSASEVIASFKDGTPTGGLDDKYLWVFSEKPVAQTFSIDKSYTVEQLKLFLTKSPDLNTNIEIYIMETEGGKPNGKILSDGKLNAGALDDFQEKWVEVDMKDKALGPGTYAIVYTSPDSTNLDSLLLIPRISSISFPYEGGSLLRKDNIWGFYSYNTHFEVIGSEGGISRLLIIPAIIIVLLFVGIMVYLKIKR